MADHKHFEDIGLPCLKQSNTKMTRPLYHNQYITTLPTPLTTTIITKFKIESLNFTITTQQKHQI